MLGFWEAYVIKRYPAPALSRYMHFDFLACIDQVFTPSDAWIKHVLVKWCICVGCFVLDVVVLLVISILFRYVVYLSGI